ncbi:MAG: T9SS type A sorting domain-containing protein, partial [Spirochaetaceae bacterium]|nr:T9SS type A sorting domain-containing protein [Spirochaetaceae bacterium]
LYYDVIAGDEDFLLDTDTLGSSSGTRVWLPVESPLGDDRSTEEVLEFLPRNDEARRLTPTTSSGALREYTIPADDSEIVEGATLEFLFTLGGLPVVTAADPTDPRTLVPWRIGFRRFIEQRGGVTILNNVIYPENGDQTVLTYDVPRAGMVTINVFTLDGQLVKTLIRGRQGEGRQIVSWDGINASGQIVASGLYFIRVVGPDIDEIRKVLVAK